MKKYISIVLAAALTVSSAAVLASCVNPVLDTSKLVGLEEETDRTIAESESSKNYFTYEIIEGDKIAITEYHGSNELHDIKIPASIDGREVTSIGDEAFKGLSNIRSVTLPECLTYIGNYAFANCGFLESVTLDNVVSIGKGAFYNCVKLDNFGQTCTALTEIGDYAFFGCENLTSAVVGDSLKTIGNYAFYGCNKIERVYMPDSVEKIGDYAFYNCKSLVAVYLGSNLKIKEVTDEVTGNVLETVYPIGQHAFEAFYIEKDNNDVQKIVATDLTVSCIYGTYAQSYAAQNLIGYIAYKFDIREDFAVYNGEYEDCTSAEDPVVIFPETVNGLPIVIS